MSKPFIERLILDNTNLKIIRENKQKINGFALFKKSFFGQLWNNVKTNWIMIAFCIPVMVWLFISQLEQAAFDITNPYSGNIGIGYPIVNDAHIAGALHSFNLAMKRALVMMPLIIIGSLGLAGVFNVVKYFCWGFQIKIVKTFFRGIKNSYASFVWVGMMLAVSFVIITFLLNIFNIYPVALGWRIAAYAGCVIFCTFLMMLCVFITTQAAVFNLTLFEILKNSFHLGTKFLFQNSLILIAGLVSMVLPLLTFQTYIQLAAYVLFFLLSFSWTATVWTIYGHSIYDMMYNPDAPKKGVPGQRPQQKAEPRQSAASQKEEQKAGQQAKPYRSPKKNKKRS